VFPEGAPTVVLPIRDPLLGPSLEIEAKLFTNSDEAARTIETWIAIDSGASYPTLPEAMAERLRLERLRGVRFKVSAHGSRTYDKQAVLLPVLEMGGLPVRSVLSSVAGDTPLVGESVLAHAPWEIDWDRGTLTLGAPVWPDDTPGVIAVALRHDGPSDTDVATLSVGGHPFDVLLDTGAVMSGLPPSAGNHLPGRAFEATMPFRGALEVIPVRRQFYGEAKLGPASLGTRGFAEIGGRADTVGVLGLDLLAHYRVEVIPGKRLLLRPRQDLWQTGRERIGRWAWTKECPHLGCVRAEIEPAGAEAWLTLEFDRPFSRPMTMVLGCDGDAAALISTSEIWAQGGQMRGEFHHIVARIDAGAVGIVTATVRLGGSLWFARPTACRELSVLDVVPMPDAERPSAKLAAYVAF
jgi:hypothetical protein